MANIAYSDSDPRMVAYAKQKDDEAQEALKLDKELYTYAEVGTLLGISKERVGQYVNSDKYMIEPRKLGAGRRYYITAEDVRKIWRLRKQVFIVKKNKDQPRAKPRPILIPLFPELSMATA